MASLFQKEKKMKKFVKPMVKIVSSVKTTTCMHGGFVKGTK